MAGSGRSLVLTLRKRRAAAPAPAPGTRPAPPLVSLRGGMSALTAAIVGSLGRAHLVTGAPVRALRPREDGRWSVVTDDVTYEADHVVLAVPLTLIGFYLNGLGYVVLAAALCLPQLARYRRPIRWLLMGYTALTISLWVALGQPYTIIGYVDKAIELALIGLLWVDHRRSNRYPRADAVRAA